MKKNRVSIGGKSFHVTTSGKILPSGRKSNTFTACMSKNTIGKMNTGINLSASQLEANKNTWASALSTCSGKGTSYASKLKYARGYSGYKRGAAKK